MSNLSSKRHDDFHDVEAVGAEIVGQPGVCVIFSLSDPRWINEDLSDLYGNV